MSTFGKYCYTNLDTTKPLYIFGAGEFARIAAHYFSEDSPFNIEGFVVDDEFLENSTYLGFQVLKSSEFYVRFGPSQVNVFVAFSGAQLSIPRLMKVDELKLAGYTTVSYVSSHTFIDSDTEIGSNVFIFENNTIQSQVSVGDATVVWSGNHIGHQTKIGAGCFVSSHVCIGGNTKIANNCYFGMNSTIRDGIIIGTKCVVGANSYVNKSQDGNSVIFGIPAKPIRGIDPMDAI